MARNSTTDLSQAMDRLREIQAEQAAEQFSDRISLRIPSRGTKKNDTVMSPSDIDRFQAGEKEEDVYPSADDLKPPSVSISLSVSQKVMVAKFEPAEAFLSIQGVTVATTDQEIDDALDLSRVVYKKITTRLRDQVAKLRAGEVLEED